MYSRRVMSIDISQQSHSIIVEKFICIIHASLHSQFQILYKIYLFKIKLLNYAIFIEIQLISLPFSFCQCSFFSLQFSPKFCKPSFYLLVGKTFYLLIEKLFYLLVDSFYLLADSFYFLVQTFYLLVDTLYIFG